MVKVFEQFPPGHAAKAEPEDPGVPGGVSDALNGTERDVWVAMRANIAHLIDTGKVAANAVRSTFQALADLDRMIREYDALHGEEGVNESPEGGDEFDPETI